MPFEYLLYGRERRRYDELANDKALFLTFDDGPQYCTGSILDILAARSQRATFFMIGRNLTNAKLREFAVRALREGHEIGNHSYDHPDFSTISAKRAEREILSTHSLIEELIVEAGIDPERQNLYFRFPYGVAGSRSNYDACQEVLASLNYKIAWWNLDTNDWRMNLEWFSRPASAVLQSLKGARAADVVLLHDRSKTAQHLPAILGVLQAKALVSITLSHYEITLRIASNQNTGGKSPGRSGSTGNRGSSDLLADLFGRFFPSRDVIEPLTRSGFGRGFTLGEPW